MLSKFPDANSLTAFLSASVELFSVQKLYGTQCNRKRKYHIFLRGLSYLESKASIVFP